jgi:hypothetical protein
MVIEKHQMVLSVHLEMHALLDAERLRSALLVAPTGAGKTLAGLRERPLPRAP